MEYANFNIKNFKGIKDVSIDLTRVPKPRIFTFVGLNESGKTTILEAIDFFRNDTEPQQSYRNIPKSKKSNFNESITITATLKLNDEDGEEISKYALENLGFTIKNKIGTIEVTKNWIYESKFKEFQNLWSIKISGTRKDEE